MNNSVKNNTRIFLIFLFISWALRMLFVFDSLFDMFLMLTIALIIYANKYEK